MADSKPSILVTFKKFANNFHIKNVISSKISAGFCNLAVLDRNGCLYIRNVRNDEEKSLQKVKGFEWGVPTSLEPDQDCLDLTSDDFLIIVKDDLSVVLYSVQANDKNNENKDSFTVSCDVEIKEDLLKGLLRDRGKVDCTIQEVSIIAMTTEKNPANHMATLLVNHKYIVVFSLSDDGVDDVLCFAMENSMPSLPIMVPVSSLVQVKRSHSLIFCLFSSGTAMIHHISGEFIGCIDIQSYHSNTEDTDSEDNSFIDNHLPIKFVNLEVTDDLSVLVSSDECNNIYTVNLDDYFIDNPNHLCYTNKMSKKTFKYATRGLQYCLEDEDLLLRSNRMSQIEYGDRFWKIELLEMRLEVSKDPVIAGKTIVRWFHHIKDIKFRIPSQGKQCSHYNSSTKKSQLSGFLLKRRKSEARSITPSSESSISLNKESIMSKCPLEESKSLLYSADVFTKDYRVVSLFAASDSMVVWLRPVEDERKLDVGYNCSFGLLYLYGYGSTEVAYHQIFSEPTVMVHSSDPLQPACVLTRKNLSMPSFGINQNQFVHKVIMYENAALAEGVCHVNQWDHCVIPLEALQVALKHRQLDTIAFFLKTQENVFTSSLVCVTSPTVCVTSPTLCVTSPTASLSPQQSFSSSSSIIAVPVAMDTKQTEDVVNALVASVKKNAKQHHNLQFTSQLLQMTLKYLHCLLQDGTQFIEKKRVEIGTNQSTNSTTQPAIVIEVENCLVFVTKNIDELRHYLSNLPDDSEADVVDSDVKGVAFSDVGEGSWDAMETWLTMDTKDIISDAVIHGKVGTAQVHFMSTTNKEALCDGSLSSITMTGLEIMLSTLVNQDIDTAIKIIANLGRDVIDQLRDLCFNTLHRPLRDFLVAELRSRGHLTYDEEEMLQFVVALETLYNIQCFDMAKKAMKSQSESWTDLGLLRNAFNLGSNHVLEANMQTGSLLSGNSSKPIQSSNGGYAEILLDWVQGWNPEARQRILLEQILSDKDSSKNTFSISAQALWHYFASRGDWRMMKGWIQAMALDRDVSLDDLLLSVDDDLSVCHTSITLPPLSRDVYSGFPACPAVIKDIVVDELTRYGFFTNDQLSNLSLLLHHLCRTQTLFKEPHPLVALEQSDPTTQSDDRHGDANQDPPTQSNNRHGDVNQGQIISLADFHGRFIEYCITMQFVNVLYHYLDFYRLAESLHVVAELKLDTNQSAWVEMLVAFRLAGKQPEDKDSMFRASLSNARLVLNSDSVTSVTDIFREGHPVMALATLMYGPHPISQAIVPGDETPEDPTWQVDEVLLQRSLLAYPKLLSALFPVTTSVHGLEPQDITVYQLLQGNSTFEISRMFGWQHTNELALKADMVGEMPHFSLAPFVSQHAHQEQLTFSYYLRHGRPSFAFAAFVGKQLKELAVTRTSILAASKKAYRVAIQNFTDSQITSCCVVFTEMLGVDSSGLRIDLKASNRILSHGGRDSLQGVESRDGKTLKDKIVSELLSRGSRLQTYFLPALEEATSNLISKVYSERTSYEASQQWSLVIEFCNIHKIDLSAAYLVDCAKVDKWVPFVCFAQVWQFPQHQVLEVVNNHFSNRHLREHLRLAFENVQIVTIETTPEETKKRRRRKQSTKKDTKPQVVTPTKDIRAQFYARMGLNKAGIEPPTGPHSSSAEEEDDKSKLKQPKTSGKDSSSATDGNIAALEELSKTTTENLDRPLDPDTLPDNLFDVLFSCQSAKIPWRSLLAHAIALHRSLFVVLAACYEESKSLDCICAWLYSVLNPDILDVVTQDLQGVQWHRWTQRDLSALITTVMKYKDTYAATLTKAFYIFDPTNPMFHFLRFHESFVVHFDFDSCQKELDLFMKGCSKLPTRENTVSHATLCVTRDIRWIEEVTSLVTQQMVRQCNNTYEQSHLLSLLAKSRFGRMYTYKTPNYYHLHKINEIVRDSKVVVEFSLLLEEQSEHSTQERQRILHSLLDHKEFVLARDYARLLQLPEDPITLKEVQHERESIENSVLWGIKQGRLAFWHKADKCFKENRCDPQIAASFFEAQAEDSELSSSEKSCLLSMTLRWYSKTKGKSAEKLVDLERRIWLCCIRAEMEKNREFKFARSVSHLEFLPSSSDWTAGFPLTYADSPEHDDHTESTELILPETSEDEEATCADLLKTDEEFSALERVIGQLLESCHVVQARRVAAHFGYTSQDLDIVLSCIHLSQGTRFADTLDDSIRKLLHQTPHRRISVSGTASSLDGPIKRSGSFVLSTSFTESVGRGGDDSISVDWIQVEDTITAMETLMYYCEKGKKCCTRIIACYKISQTFGLEYDAVVTDKPFNVLHSLLVSCFDSRYKLADAYIKAFELIPNEVVGFLKDIILLSLRVYCGDELSSGEHELIFNAAPSCDDIFQVIKLCSDQALLGNRLLETAGNVANERISRTGSSKALNLEVELLVRAHECHTMACNMEGITSVLKCGKQLTTALADAEEYRLMVRLLTGIGRFREMSYIFDTLLQHHHFELLCQRGIDKENKLKVALLEYLKRSHPDDAEKYNIVAMHFSMYREIAETWKNSAMEQLKALKDQLISARPELQSKLTSIMNSFKYATDYYTKDSCLQLSQTCLKHARLVQLQIHLLSIGERVINLDEKGLKKFLAKHNHFFEALLVVNAYNKKGSHLWIKAVYNHVIVSGDWKYWHDLKSVMVPPSVLFVDVANKYKNHEPHPTQETQNMKKLLSNLPEQRVRYRIATDIGFRDVAAAMLEGEGGAYLRDILNI